MRWTISPSITADVGTPARVAGATNAGSIGSRPSRPSGRLRLGLDLDAAWRQRTATRELDLAAEDPEPDRHPGERDALADHEQRHGTFGTEHRVSAREVRITERDDREHEPTDP